MENPFILLVWLKLATAISLDCFENVFFITHVGYSSSPFIKSVTNKIKKQNTLYFV